MPAVETEAALCMDLAVTEPPSLTEVIGGNLLQTKRAHTHLQTHTTRALTHTTPIQSERFTFGLPSRAVVMAPEHRKDQGPRKDADSHARPPRKPLMEDARTEASRRIHTDCHGG